MLKLVNLTTDKNCKAELYKYSWEPHNQGYFPRSHNWNLYIKTQGYTVEFNGGGIFKRHLITCHVLHVFCLIAIIGVNNLILQTQLHEKYGLFIFYLWDYHALKSPILQGSGKI